MSDFNPTDRRGQFGAACPAFTVHRFKRTITVNLNEEMAEALNQVLVANEKAAESKATRVAPFLYEFTNQLQDAIDMPPPAKGEKPEVLAPGRRRDVAVKAVS